MKTKVQLTDFGAAVKKRLVELNESQSWLVQEVHERTGKYFDSAYLQKLMTGKATSAPIVETIREILDIKEGNGGE